MIDTCYRKHMIFHLSLSFKNQKVDYNNNQ